METQNNLTIECRPNSDSKWFRVGALENATLQEAEKFVENVQKTNLNTQSYEYRIVKG